MAFGQQELIFSLPAVFFSLDSKYFSLCHWKWNYLGILKGPIPFIFLLNELNASMEVCYLLRDGMLLLGPLVIRALVKTMNWEHKWSDRKR